MLRSVFSLQLTMFISEWMQWVRLLSSEEQGYILSLPLGTASRSLCDFGEIVYSLGLSFLKHKWVGFEVFFLRFFQTHCFMILWTTCTLSQLLLSNRSCGESKGIVEGGASLKLSCSDKSTFLLLARSNLIELILYIKLMLSSSWLKKMALCWGDSGVTLTFS